MTMRMKPAVIFLALALPMSGCAMINSLQPKVKADTLQQERDLRAAQDKEQAEKEAREQQRAERLQAELAIANKESQEKGQVLFVKVRGLAAKYSAGPDAPESVARAVQTDCANEIAAFAKPVTEAALISTTLRTGHAIPYGSAVVEYQDKTLADVRRQVFDEAVATVVKKRTPKR